MFKHLLKCLHQGVYKLIVPRRISTSVSDNQAYPQICLRASNDYKVFNRFRRNPIYNEILEHASEEQGLEYLKIISGDPELMAKISDFKDNDRWGNPRMYFYEKAGLISPTTLRYIKVLADLKVFFGHLNGFNICEIGVGYGGQCRIINACFAPSTYRLVDIQPALALAQRYLDNYIMPAVLDYKTMNQLPAQSYDLVVSNYAFTELPRTFQDIYLDKIILRAERGYITYNQLNPAEFDSYKAEELVAMIPGSRRLDERPLTYPGNCIISWGKAG